MAPFLSSRVIGVSLGLALAFSAVMERLAH